VGGEERPLPRSQHTAITLPGDDKVFIFGGHHTPQVRLNDAWIYQVNKSKWMRADGSEPESPKNQPSAVGGPAPRANAGACLHNGKVYLYGGHGGVGFARVAFQDLYAYDIETQAWEKIDYVTEGNPTPEPRCGHTMFGINQYLYIYGGWNNENQFNNIWRFDLEKCEWYEPDILNEIPRWNHTALMVHAIPSWKYFIFGGEVGDFPEGGPRHFGVPTNTACFLDINSMNWSTIQTEDAGAEEPVLPPTREYSAMAYDHRDRRLLVFGGWNNGWLDDLWALNVSKIVGPSYAITEIEPNLGQLSGKVPATIRGIGFKDSNIKVIFTCGRTPVDSVGKQSIEVNGTFVSDTELTCETPSFEAFGPKEAVVQLQLGSGDLTTTSVNFTYFMNTRGYKCLAYGPGLLDDGAVGHPTEFVIQARNENGENRKSGRDNFEIKITTVPAEEGGEVKQIPCNITDKDDGHYIVDYQVDEPCEVKIDILFFNAELKWVPIRGSPYRASFSPKAAANVNNLTGPAMGRYIASSLEEVHKFIAETHAGASTKEKNIQDVKTLISVKDNVE